MKNGEDINNCGVSKLRGAALEVTFKFDRKGAENDAFVGKGHLEPGLRAEAWYKIFETACLGKALAEDKLNPEKVKRLRDLLPIIPHRLFSVGEEPFFFHWFPANDFDCFALLIYYANFLTTNLLQ